MSWKSKARSVSAGEIRRVAFRDTPEPRGIGEVADRIGVTATVTNRYASCRSRSCITMAAPAATTNAGAVRANGRQAGSSSPSVASAMADATSRCSPRIADRRQRQRYRRCQQTGVGDAAAERDQIHPAAWTARTTVATLNAVRYHACGRRTRAVHCTMTPAAR